ncbi:MAG: hypothetical protein ACJ74Z_17470 [Bryobacteraceae bacterium]
MFRKTVILSGFTLAFLMTQGQATTYYLDSTSGNNFLAGAQTAAPWRDLRYASSMLYHPGDQILLKAGSVWQGQTLNIATTEESDEPIVVGSYGEGNQPVLDGLNGVESPVNLSSASNVVISGLTIQSSKVLISIVGGHNNTVRNCTLVNAGTFATSVSNSPAFTFSNNSYASTGTHALQGQVLHAVGTGSGIKVIGNKLTFNSASKGAIGLYVVDISNAEVANNVIHGGGEPIGIKAVHRSVSGTNVHDNAIYDTITGPGDGEAIEFTGWPGTGYTVSGKVHHNFIRGIPSTTNGIAVRQSRNVICYNNIIVGHMWNAAFHWTVSSTGGVFYGNTIHGTTFGFAIYSGSGGVIRNNIVSGTGVAIAVSRASVSEDYNIFYSAGSRGVSKGGHSNTSNPRFVSSSPSGPLDVKLQSGSPAIHTGAGLGSSYALALDPASTRFPCTMLNQGTYGWDRGAFGHK